MKQEENADISPSVTCELLELTPRPRKLMSLMSLNIAYCIAPNRFGAIAVSNHLEKKTSPNRSFVRLEVLFTDRY